MFSRIFSYKGPFLLALALIVLGVASGAVAQETGGVKGKIRTASGSGIPNATVSARQNGENVKTVNADSKGDFLIAGLAPGRYNVLFDAKGYSSGVLYNVEVKKKKVSDLGDRLILTTDQGTLVIIKGSVFYKEGTSITGAKVECDEVLSDGSTRKLANSLTNESGEFTFKMREGVKKIRITAAMKGVSGSKDLEVDQAAIYRLAISLDLSRTDKE